MTNQPEPIRKSSLPTTPPPEWEYLTVVGARTGTDGCTLIPGDMGPGVVRRLVTYGDWEPVRPDRWADEPESAAVSTAVAPPTDQEAPEGPQERPEGGPAGLGPSEPLTGAQAGADSLAHSCTNCEGADPDTCLFNPDQQGTPAAFLAWAADVAEEVAEELRARHEFERSTGALDVVTELRRMADETATETPAVDLPTLAAALDGLHTLIATSSRDWQTYRVDAWLWAVLAGWDCEQTEHDDTCVHGALEETAAMHGWDEATVAKARRYRAAVRAVTEALHAAGARQDGAET